MSGECWDRRGGSGCGRGIWRGTKIGTMAVDWIVEGRSRMEVAEGGCGGDRCSQGGKSLSGGGL
jgi:hypothetical protein